MEISYPDNWERKQLHELIEFVTGGDWGKDPSHEDEVFELAYCIRGSEIRNWETEKGKTASLRKVKRSSVSTRKLQEGDILVEISGGGPEQPVGRTVMIDKEVLHFEPDVPKICTNFLRLVRPKKEVASSFLNLFLKLVYTSGEVVKFQGGSNNLRNLKFADYSKIDIPLPPLPEQQRIVAKIEELFSELDAGKQELEKAAQQLKVYRQAVLKWAFEGRLTNDVVDGELPDGWKWTNVGAIAKQISDGPFGSNLKTSDYTDSGVRVIRLENIGELVFKDEYKTYVSEEKYESIKKHTVTGGDIIFSSFIGEMVRTVVLPDFIDRAVNKADCFLIRTSEDTVDRKYLTYCLSTKPVYNQLALDVHGATRPRINTTQLKAVNIPFAPLEEQHRIVQEIEARLSVCDKIEGTIAESLQQAETLRQSILKKAFEGKI